MGDSAKIVNGISFTRTAPDGVVRAPYRLHRVTGKAPVTGIILATEVFGTYVHFYHGSSKPCLGDSCDACDWRNVAAWHGYIGFQMAKSNEVVVLDILPNIAETLNQLISQGQPIRGLQVKIWRTNGQNSGTMAMSKLPEYHDGYGLHPPVDVIRHMFCVWRIGRSPVGCDPSEGDVARSTPKQRKTDRRDGIGQHEATDTKTIGDILSAPRLNGSHRFLPGQKVLPGIDSQKETS